MNGVCEYARRSYIAEDPLYLDIILFRCTVIDIAIVKKKHLKGF